MSRQFLDELAQPGLRPLLLGLVGPSGSGKTYSALRLATGIQKVKGGDIYYVDTEANRALHYADLFKFRHVPFVAPFGPLDYQDAIAHCVAKRAGVCIVDSMTHEHTGVGGILDQSEEQLNKWCGDDEPARKRNLLRSFIKPKMERRKLIDYIVHCGAETSFIFCFRAKEGIDIKDKDKFGNPREKGYMPETTSPLQYEMAAQFLLLPGSDGHPTLTSDKREEAAMIKFPAQFRDWFPASKRVQLDESLGERFGRWMLGPNPETPAAPATAPDPNPLGIEPHEVQIGDFAVALDCCKKKSDYDAVVKEAAAYVKQHGLSGSILAPLSAAKQAAMARLKNA